MADEQLKKLEELETRLEALETNDLSNEYVEEIRDDIEERL